ncbi:MAG: hypothetical protein Q7J04_01415 [Microcella sp.]|nr:hypothetical protein [Microcella sp.]
MIVNRRHRFIFMKTKKTGSSSTEVWLKHYSSPDDTIVSPRGVGREDPRRNHSSAKEIYRLVGDDVWREFLVITNVRQPWDKMVSLLFFRPGRTARYGSGSLEITDVHDARRRLEAMTRHFVRSSCDAFLEPDSPPVDRVIRQDRLDADLRSIAVELELPDRDRPIGREKSRVRPDWARDWRPLYTDAAIESVATCYGDWIETYGYRFDSPEAAR